MAITVKSFSQIVYELIGWVQTHCADVDDFNDGSINKSYLEAIALELDFSNLQIENAQAAQTINAATGVDLDAKVGDYGVVRNAAIAATGQLMFVLSAPAPVGGFVIGAGTIVSTPASFNPYAAVEFKTVTALTIPAGQTTGYVSGIAIVPGSAGNQALNSIVVLTTNVPGVKGVTNSMPFTGGSDTESDSALRARGKLALLGTVNDLSSAFQAAAAGVPSVLSAAVAGFGDPLMTRDGGQGGKVDVYYQASQNIQQTSESFKFNGYFLGGDYHFSPFQYAPPNRNVLRSCPVTAIVSVQNITQGTTISPAQYALVNDALIPNSDRADDYLHWVSTAGSAQGDLLTVTFNFDSTVGAVRAAVEKRRGATVDILVRAGQQVPVNITVTVNSETTASVQALQASLGSYLAVVLASKTLNQDLLQSQLAQLIMEYAGVQNLVLPFGLLSTGLTGVSDILVNESQYIVPGTISVVVQPPLSIQ